MNVLEDGDGKVLWGRLNLYVESNFIDYCTDAFNSGKGRKKDHADTQKIVEIVKR